MEAASGALWGIGAEQSTFIDRLKTIMAYWPSADREINGQRLLERVQRKYDDSLALISANSASQPATVDWDTADDVKVVGCVRSSRPPI